MAVTQSRPLLVKVGGEEIKALVIDGEAAPLLGDAPFAKDEILTASLESEDDRRPLFEGRAAEVVRRCT